MKNNKNSKLNCLECNLAVSQSFSVVSSSSMAMVTCDYPGIPCRLVDTFGPMKHMTQVKRNVEHIGTCSVTIRPQVAPEQLEQMTSAIAILAQNICEQCVKSQTKQRH